MTTPPATEATEPGSPVIAGDHADDDGVVLDSLFQTAPEPPRPAAPPLGPGPAPVPPRTPTRLLTGGMTVTPGHGAVLILPADPLRKCLTLSVLPPGSGDAAPALRIAEDSGRVMTDNGSLLLTQARHWDGVAHYTGAVWVACSGSNPSAGLYLTYAAVTGN